MLSATHSPSHLRTSAQWKPALVPTGGANGISPRPLWRLPPDEWADKATEKQSSRWEGGWHQAQETSSQENSRAIAWFPEYNTANLSRPEARLQSKATLNSPPLLLGLLWQPGICKPKQTWKRIPSLAPKVFISKLFAEGSCCPFWCLPDGGLAKSLETSQREGYFNLE